MSEIPAIPDGPKIIELSNEERDTGNLTPLHLFSAIDAFYVDGFVVLQNAIDIRYIDALNQRMLRDTETLKANPDKIHWNQGRGKGNVSQNPPFEREYMYPQIYANKPAAQVMSNVLGPRPQLRYIRTNTLVGNTAERQKVHKDCGFDHLSHPFHIALNISLVDTSPQNGSTELWLGTARISEYEDSVPGVLGIKEDRLTARRAVRPPVHPSIPRGSLVLRDIRLWHAGMPNHIDQTRIMLALGYQATWHGCTLRNPVPEGLREVIEGLERVNETEFCVEYVPDGEFDNLYSAFNADFSSAIRPERGSVQAGEVPLWKKGQ